MSKRKGAELLAKREHGPYTAWPRCCANSEYFYRLSYIGRALLLELLGQHNGRNNGDLTCAWSVLRRRGWKSKGTIQRAKDELLRTGWIVVTRYGGLGVTELYALTFFDVDDCQGKVDRTQVGRRFSYWRNGNNPDHVPKRRCLPRRSGRPVPRIGSDCPEVGAGTDKENRASPRPEGLSGQLETISIPRSAGGF